jgi:hypothetical protein
MPRILARHQVPLRDCRSRPSALAHFQPYHLVPSSQGLDYDRPPREDRNRYPALEPAYAYWSLAHMYMYISRSALGRSFTRKISPLQ